MAFTAISKLDPVSRNCVWEEHVRKESRNMKLSDTFMITNADKSKEFVKDTEVFTQRLV